MKKIIIFSALAALVVAGCTKTRNTVSTTVTRSTPTISFSGGSYYSIPVGGSLPSISATAYDTFYAESTPVAIDASTLDNTTPGLYIVSASSTNKYGMIGYANVYVAVTNIDPAINLTGTYARASNGVLVHVNKLATGLYRTDNVGGVDGSNPNNLPLVLPAVFVQIDDTTIILPSQVSAQGTIYGTNASITMAPADTAFRYVVNPNPPFGSSLRVFKKQ